MAWTNRAARGANATRPGRRACAWSCSVAPGCRAAQAAHQLVKGVLIALAIPEPVLVRVGDSRPRADQRNRRQMRRAAELPRRARAESTSRHASAEAAGRRGRRAGLYCLPSAPPAGPPTAASAPAATAAGPARHPTPSTIPVKRPPGPIFLGDNCPEMQPTGLWSQPGQTEPGTGPRQVNTGKWPDEGGKPSGSAATGTPGLESDVAMAATDRSSSVDIRGLGALDG